MKHLYRSRSINVETFTHTRCTGGPARSGATATGDS
jgi:hypothetical protein